MRLSSGRIKGLLLFRNWSPHWSKQSSCLVGTQAAIQDNSSILDVKSSQPLSSSFRENSAYMSNLIGNLKSKTDHICQGGGSKAIERDRSRGKMLPRERIQALLDPGSPFLELSQLAGYGLYGELKNNQLDR